MKGLNLINSFVKGIINHGKKTAGPVPVVLCLFIAFTNISFIQKCHCETASTSNGIPYFASDNKWYSLYAPETKEGDKDYTWEPSVYPPTKSSTLNFEFWGTNGTKSYKRKLGVQNYVGTSYTNANPNETEEFNNTSYSGHHYYTNGTCNENTTKLKLYIKEYNLYGKWKACSLKIELAQHVRLYTGNPDNTVGTTGKTGDTQVTRNFGSTTIVGQTNSNCTINIRSFLTATNLTMQVVQDDGDVSGSTAIGNIFRIKYLNNTASTGKVTITTASNICGYPNGTTTTTTSTTPSTPINTSIIPIIIEYHPAKAELRKGKLVFYDGTNVMAEVHLSGSAVWPTLSFNNTTVLSNHIQTYSIPSVMGSNLTINAPDGYFVRYNNGEWKKTLTAIPQGASIDIKFQPYKDGDFNKSLTIGTCTLNVKGKGLVHSKNFGNTKVITGSQFYGGNGTSWYTLPGDFFASSSSTYSITINPTTVPATFDKTTSNDAFLANFNGTGTRYARSIPDLGQTIPFRIAFFPKNYKTDGYSCTVFITDSKFTGINYEIKLSGKPLTASDTISLGTPICTASVPVEIDLARFRPSSGQGDLKITAPPHFLLKSKTSSTWTDTLYGVKTDSKIDVIFVPDHTCTTSEVQIGDLVVHDNSPVFCTSTDEDYHLNIKGTATAVQPISIKEPTLVGHLSEETKSFELANFIPEEGLEVTVVNGTAATNYYVCNTSGGTFSAKCTIPNTQSPKTFYVKFHPVSGGAHNETIRVKDLKTKRTYDIPVTGTASNKLTFAKTYKGQASAPETVPLIGTCTQATAPNGYLLSADNGATWVQSISTSTTSLKIKYQPNDNEDGTALTYTDDSGNQSIDVEGTKDKYTITTDATKIGFARDVTMALTNFTYTNATVSIPTSKDYYLSSEGGEDPDKWGQTSVVLNSNTLHVKFQPSDTEADRTGDIVITADGKSYTISAAGTAEAHTGTIAKVTVGTSRQYGLETSGKTSNWYYFRNGSGDSPSETDHAQWNKLDATFIVKNLSATSPASISLKDGSDLDFSINTSSDVSSPHTITEYIGTNSYYRVAYSPREATNNTSCTVVIAANGKTYSYTVSSSAEERHIDFGNVKVGKSSGYKGVSISQLRSSRGTNKGYSVTAPVNYLVSKDKTTWTNYLKLGYYSNYDDSVYIKFVPESAADFGETQLYIVDAATTDSRGQYRINVKGVGEESSMTLSDVVDIAVPQKFDMSNFTPSGKVTVTAPQHYYVSKDNSSFGSSVTLDPGETSFWVRQETSSTPTTFAQANVTMKDEATTRTYTLKVQGTVSKRPGTIIVPDHTAGDTIYLYSNDQSEQLIVDMEKEVYGKFNGEKDAELTSLISLSADESVNQYIEFVDGKSVKVKRGITSTVVFPVTASISSENTRYDATARTFYIRIRYASSSQESSLTWKKASDGNWYVYNNQPQISNGSTKINLTINIYLPKANCPNSTFAIQGGGLICGFASTLYLDGTSKQRIEGEASCSFDKTRQPISISSTGKESILTTNTNCHMGSDYCKSTGNTSDKFAEIIIPVPVHYDAKADVTKSIATEVGEVSYVDIFLTEMFKSFRTDKGLVIADNENTDNAFSYNTTNLVAADNVMSPYTPLSDPNNGFIVDENGNYRLRIYFRPLAEKSYTGVFYLQDNGNTKFTITVNGQGIVSTNEPQHIVWNQDLSQFKNGDGEVTLSATSSSGLSVEFEKVSGNINVNSPKMTITGEGEAEVRAKCGSDTINGVIYRDTTMERSFVIKPSTPNASYCSLPFDVSSWNHSTTSYFGGTTYSVTTNTNGAKELTGDYSVSALSFDIAFAENTTDTIKLYLDGTTDANMIGGLITTAGHHTISLAGKTVGKGSKLYCSFTGKRTNSGTISYTFTNFALTAIPQWTQTATTIASFSSQRVGQTGESKYVNAANFAYTSGAVSATITGADANCFAITSANPIMASCEAGVASFDVKFTPQREGNDIQATLHVTGPYGDTKDITLTGEGTKRDLKVEWDYATATTPRTVYAVGDGNKLEWDVEEDNAYAYDKLRGADAKTYDLINYVITYAPDVERLYTDANKQALVEITRDKNNKVNGIKATGYGSGIVYITATVSTGNSLFNPISVDTDKVTLTVEVKKVEADIIVYTDRDDVADWYFGDKVTTTEAKAYIKGTTTQIVDKDGTVLHSLQNGSITITDKEWCNIVPADDGYNKILNLWTANATPKLTAHINADAVVKEGTSKTDFNRTTKKPEMLVINKLGAGNTVNVYADSTEDVDLISLVRFVDQRHSAESIGGQGAPMFYDNLIDPTTGEAKLYADMELGEGKSYEYKIISQTDVCGGDIGSIKMDDTKKTAILELTGTATGLLEIKLSTTGKDKNNTEKYGTAEQTFYVNVIKSTPLLYLTDDKGEHLGTSEAPYTRTITYGDQISLSARAESKNDNNKVFYNSTDGLTISATGNGGYYSNGKLYATKVNETITVNISQTANCLVNETSNDNYIYTVQKATPTITWVTQPTDFTYPGSITAKATTSNTEQGATLTYTVSPAGAATVTENGDGTITITANYAGGGVNSVTVTATSVETANFKEVSLASSSFKIDWGTLTLTLNKNALPALTSVSIIDLSTVEGLVSTNYAEGISYSYSVVAGQNDTAHASVSGSTLTIKSVGNINLQATATHSSSGKSDTKSTGSVNVGIGTLVFDNHANDDKWMTGGNWSPHYEMVPDRVNFDAKISATCEIAKVATSDNDDAVNGIAKCHDLTIDAGTLNVSADCVLDVAGTINNTTASKFVLKASTTNSATVVFGAGSPDATIEMYFKGNTHEEFGGGYKNPEWQYRGYIGNYTGGLSSDVSVYKWDEKEDGENVSRWKVASDHLPWAGYCMANMTDQPADYSYTTKLIPIPQSGSVSPYTITYTTKQGNDTLTGAGVNILTNSYSAPLKVSELTFTNMNSVVYFFKNDYYLSWKKGKASAYVSCPTETCAEVCGDDRIPAGHGFLVQADATRASSLSIPSSAIITNEPSGAYYAPAQRRFNTLSITVTGGDIEDELFLLENENCSWRYDNGYDGTKMFADGLPQIYAQNKFGNTSINADSSMLGQFIGFRGIAEITEYEMKFNTDRLEGFTELYLFDHLTRRYADILAGGTYHFSAAAGDDPQRFQIMGRRDDGTYFTGEDQWIEVIGSQALLHGFDNDNEPIYITDLMGKRAWSDNSKNGPWFNLPDLPAGVYIIHCGKATAKFVSK